MLRKFRRWFLCALVAGLVVGSGLLLPVIPTLTAPADGPAPAPALVPRGAPAVIHPHLTCPLGYPSYSPLRGGVYPLDPQFALQGPCPYIAVDEIHGTFSSAAPGSGARWTVPLTLPGTAAGGSIRPDQVSSGIYVATLVSGDPRSAWNQSLLEVLASPYPNGSLAVAYNLSLAVLSFANESALGNACGSALNLSWNQSYWCEFDDLSGRTPIPLDPGVPGGAHVRVTFDGRVGSTAGMNVFVNVTGGNHTVRNLSSATTGTYAFDPAYGAACADLCDLQWGLTYGEGVGLDVCPYFAALTVACDSYNGTAWAALPSLTFGVPEFWNGSGYTGNFTYLAPESASGVCDTNPPGGQTVAACHEFVTNGGNGFYPAFALTTQGLALGSSPKGTATTWGGAYGQYLSTPSAQDLVPFVITRVHDSSLAGFLPPGASMNASANVTDLGWSQNVTFAYSVNGSAWTTTPLGPSLGNAEAGEYAGVVPAGPNGPIRYQFNATNAAGLAVSSGVGKVLRGPLPTFNLTLTVTPGNCGTVSVGGVSYPNGTTVPIGPGTVPVVASGCYPYRFTGWAATPGLSVAPANASRAQLTVAATGNLSASFVYVRPFQNVTVRTLPASCGVVSVDGTAYSNSEVASVSYGLTHSIGATDTCTGTVFGGWAVTGNLSVVGNALVPYGNGTLTADFVNSTTSAALTFSTQPSNCGGVGLGTVAYTNGQTIHVAPGNYSVYPAPCAHYGLLSFTTSGAVSLRGTNLTVNGSGSITEFNYHLTEVFVRTNPGSCGGVNLAGSPDGNGADVVVQNNSVYTVTAFTCPGHYLESLTATGGLSLSGSFLTVNGSGTLLVVSLPGTPTAFVGFVTNPTSCGAVILNGTSYGNGAYASLPPGGTLSISAVACPNYGFVSFVTSGEITVVNGTAYLNGSGAITANFGPRVTLLINTIPADCGSVLLGGRTYTNGGAAPLIEGDTYSIYGSPCANYALAYFETSPYVEIANNSIAPTGPSTITAVFAPLVYPVSIALTGAGCGTVYLGGAPETNGEVVGETAGNYSLALTPCRTSVLTNVSTTGGLSVVGGRLFVDGSGNLSVRFDPIPPSLTLTGSPGGFVNVPLYLFASVAVPLGTGSYSFTWSFGDGVVASTAANSTTHAYAHPGTYTVKVQVVDPYHRSANASGTVTILASSNTGLSAYLGPGTLAAGLAAVAIAGILIVGRRRPPPRREGPEDDPPPSA